MHYNIWRFTIIICTSFVLLSLSGPVVRGMGEGVGRSLSQDQIKDNSLPQRLSDSDIQAKMQDIPGWRLNGAVIQSHREFRDFVEAIAFVNRLVEPAEAAGHHPDIAISYNTVTITLTTHDVGGLTEQDFAMAEVISSIP